MYKLPIPGMTMESSPVFFRNFWQHQFDNNQYFKAVLMQDYAAEYVSLNNVDDHILFETEEDATAFVLKWS